MLALAPATVRFAAAPAFAEPPQQGVRGFRQPIRFRSDEDAPEPDRWPTGTSGEPQLASEAKGQAILSAVLDDLEAGIRRLFAKALEAAPPCGDG